MQIGSCAPLTNQAEIVHSMSKRSTSVEQRRLNLDFRKMRPLVLAAKTITEAISVESKVAEVGSKLAAESVALRNQPTQSAAGRTILTLGDVIKPTAAKSADKVVIASRHGDRSFLLEKGRVRSTEIPRQQDTMLNGMREPEANTYIRHALQQQEPILLHNLHAARRNPENLGKFSQYSLFKPIQLRFAEISKNTNWHFVAAADGSAADLVGADALLLNSLTKQFFPVDFKHLNSLRDVPVARASGVLHYTDDYFKMVNGSWTLFPRMLEFNTFVCESAQRLTNLTERKGLFNLKETSFPSITSSAPAESIKEIRRFQAALLKSKDRHWTEYGRWLKGPLHHLQSRR